MLNRSANVSLVFALIIMLLIAQGVFSLAYLTSIASQADKLYRNSYAVSNAAHRINADLESMKQIMHNIEVQDDDKKIRQFADLVDDREHAILDNFQLIFERYLGSREDIQSAYKSFVNWKSVRDDVIYFGDADAASRLKINASEEKYEAFIQKEIQTLIDFADAQAKSYLANALESEEDAFNIISSLLAVAVIFSIFFAFYSVRRLKERQVAVQERMYLIDQNIMMAKYDINGSVIDISNHLCRHLGLLKHEVIGKQVNFFIGDDPDTNRRTAIIKVISTGKIWEGDICRYDDEGVVQWIHSVIHPELDSEFKVKSYTNIIDDITDKKSVEQLSLTDTLTGLYNRRHFDDILEKEVRISNRNKTLLTLAIIDIDYFKSYNDKYGHPAGDRTLAKVAQAIQAPLTRPADYAFRIGGEEFAVLFTNSNYDQSIEFLESMRAKIESLNIEHKGSDVCDNVSVSIGAQIIEGALMIGSNQLYVKADQALYAAKIKRNNLLVNSETA
ncbi:MAG: diguanylate cyclase [Pseudomonadales bacterium]|nr:diguanylate cyclase [Pseudomonadales bacterium]NRA14603.1 diguanylate cyclase [Oceanospirillaceae bacterium]